MIGDRAAEEILAYLESGLAADRDVSDFIQNLKTRKDQLEEPTQEQWCRLSTQRVLASNTLTRSQDLKCWQAANQWLGQEIASGHQINFKRIGELNSILTGNSGDIRKSSVFSGNDEYLPPQFLSRGLHIFDKVLKSERCPIRKAFSVYQSLVSLHPFSDGNGRTARLACDWVLIEAGFLPIAFDSAIQSHVAVTTQRTKRDKKASMMKFLTAIQNSYAIVSPIK